MMTGERSTESSRVTQQTRVPPELARRLVSGQITLAEFVGLKRETLYAIAEVGFQMLNSGRFEQAREIYRGLVAADPFDSVFHCHLAATHNRLGDLDTALAEYTASLRYNIANADALVGRGEIYLHQRKVAEAITDLRAAVEADPEGKKPSTVRARAILLALKEAANDTSG
jgi:tetratricopeptide (TPR) repeat protein